MNGITFKRKGRKSMLGTRQLKLLPIESIAEKSPSEENASLIQQPEPIITEKPVKKVVHEKTLDESSTENSVKKEIYEKPEPPQDDLVIKAVRKNLICSLFPDDSFEANETMLANTSFNETVLATTLSSPAKLKEDTIINEKNNEMMSIQKQDDTLEQVLENITLLLKRNAEIIENNKKERATLLEMKKRLLEKIHK